MGLGSILFLVVLVIAVIAFIFMVVKTASRWGILHTLLLCCLFIECWVFVVMAAGVQAERVPATRNAFKQTEAAQNAETRTAQLQWGTTVQDADNALIPMQGRLRRLTADRGRVWREVSFVRQAGNQFELELVAAADPAADDGTGAAAPAPQATSESLPVGLVVHGFGEEADEEGHPIPKYYLGEFVVRSSQAGQVSLAPTRKLFAGGQKRIADGYATAWTLYEQLPVDSHIAFAAAGSAPSTDEIFGHMDEEAIAAVFADVPEEGGRRQTLIDAYMADGLRADASTPQANLWVQIELTDNLTETIDSLDSADATERGYFNLSGRAIDDRLKINKGLPIDGEPASGTITMTPDQARGKLFIVKEEGAARLPKDKTAEAQRINVRPLNNYDGEFHYAAIRGGQLDEQLLRLNREHTEIKRAERKAAEMLLFRQTEGQALDNDLAERKKEIASLLAATKAEEAKLARVRTDMSKLFRETHASNAQHKAITESMIGN